MNRNIMQALGFSKELAAVDSGRCPICRGPITTFKDVLSRKEYAISGMCQGCQDGFFDTPEEEY